MIMNNKTNIWLVDTHAEGVGRAYYFVLVAHQFLFNILPHGIFSTCMVVISIDAPLN